MLRRRDRLRTVVSSIMRWRRELIVTICGLLLRGCGVTTHLRSEMGLQLDGLPHSRAAGAFNAQQRWIYQVKLAPCSGANFVGRSVTNASAK